jgi:Putative MetA-pathway of phenol degradation
MTHRPHPTILAIALLALSAPLSAQSRTPSETLLTDRPGLGDGTHVVAPGVWQAELGGSLESVGVDDFLSGANLVRIGFEDFEARLFVPSLFLLRSGSKIQLGDLGVGAKVPLDIPNSPWRVSAEGAFTIPSGSDASTADDPGLSFTGLAERSLSHGVSLAVNVGYGFLFGGVTDGTFSLLVTPSFPLPGHDDVSAYAGYAHFAQPGSDGKFLEGGLSRLEGTERQWDLNAGYDPWAHSWFLGVGLAQRWR